MSRADNIAERLPHFYLTWDRQTSISSITKAVGKAMDETEKDFKAIMASHWVETARREDLDRLGGVYGVGRHPGESDRDFRGRLKTSIISFKGGGTLGSLRMMVRLGLGLPGDYTVEVIENPPVTLRQTWKVSANNEWTVNPRNIADTVPQITLTVETENARISDPVIMNLDTGESIAYKGNLSFGDILIIKEGSATLNGKDATAKLSTAKMPSLPRGKTRWQYTESLGANMGVFDKSQFDRSVFAVSIVTAVTFEWVARQPASFEVRIPGQLLESSGVSKEYVQGLIDSVKAGGVKGEVIVL